MNIKKASGIHNSLSISLTASYHISWPFLDIRTDIIPRSCRTFSSQVISIASFVPISQYTTIEDCFFSAIDQSMRPHFFYAAWPRVMLIMSSTCIIQPATINFDYLLVFDQSKSSVSLQCNFLPLKPAKNSKALPQRRCSHSKQACL